MITVVLADDEALVRTALSALLPLDGEITVLAEAQDGDAAVAATLHSGGGGSIPTCRLSRWWTTAR